VLLNMVSLQPFMKQYRSIQITTGLILFALLAAQMQVSTGCANIVPPLGGEKDSLPPVLVKVVPGASALNVTGNKITMNFDEFVQLDNVAENVVISPLPKNQPDVKALLRTVTVKLRDSLEPNTTYTVDFGNAIRDVNESNILKNFRYVFSTGAALDTLELKGRVLLAQSGQTDTTLIVMLYRNHTDSAVVKEKPRYYTKLDGQGRFTFRNLPAGNFSIYTIKDEGGQKRYTSGKQLFGFYNSQVNAQQQEEPVLYAYIEEAEDARPPAATGVDARLRMQNSLEGGTQDILEDLHLNFNRAVKAIDSTKIQFTDTLGKKLEGFSVALDSQRKKAVIKYTWKPGGEYRLVVQKEFATDEKGNTLSRSDTLRFRAKTEKEYGRVKIRIEKKDLGSNPVLQLVQSGVVLKSYPLTGNRLNIPLLKPGDYDLRLLADDNRNGRWDAGNFFKGKKQPEIVTSLPEKLNVRADWDNEMDIR
jgi:uncharacterized protein (DUF2141 family)